MLDGEPDNEPDYGDPYDFDAQEGEVLEEIDRLKEELDIVDQVFADIDDMEDELRREMDGVNKRPINPGFPADLWFGEYNRFRDQRNNLKDLRILQRDRGKFTREKSRLEAELQDARHRLFNIRTNRKRDQERNE